MGRWQTGIEGSSRKDIMATKRWFQCGFLEDIWVGPTSHKDGLGYSHDLIKGCSMQFVDYLLKRDFYWIDNIIALVFEAGLNIENVYRDENQDRQKFLQNVYEFCKKFGTYANFGQ